MPPSRTVDGERSSFDVLPGWSDADLAAVWPAWQASARASLAGGAPLRAAQSADADLMRVLRRLADQPAQATAGEARRFVERHFDVLEIATPGFLTGYYEPVVASSLERTADFAAPILPRPADFVPAPPSATDGGVLSYPDRVALEDWAVGPEARPVVWLRDWTEVFLIHVQGSARVRLPDGHERRLVYAGRNGHPYTSIGRLLVESGAIAWPEMSLARLKQWLRANGQAVGEPGRALMQRNRSYIFFDLVEADPKAGPTGGAGLPLTPRVSIAVDRTLWSYGLPFWIATDGPLPGFGPEPLARLFIAQDTGSAIVGPARADLFLGSGEAAGDAAGLIRHPARVAVLLPKPA